MGDQFEKWLFDPDGRPITEADHRWMKDDIAHYWVDYSRYGEVEVSTIWHGVSDQHPPRIFETIVYERNRQVHRETYVTRAEALEGHRRLVKEYLG